MKKISIFITMLLVITMLTSCSSSNSTANQPFSDQMVNLLEKQVGKPISKVFSTLKLDKEKDFTPHENDANGYSFNEPKDLFGEDYTCTLNFDEYISKVVLFGVSYEKVTDSFEDGRKIATALYNDLVKKYDKPITYEIIPNSLSKVNEFTVESMDKSSCTDIFQVTDTIEAEVVVRFITKEFHNAEKDFIIINVRYINRDKNIFPDIKTPFKETN